MNYIIKYQVLDCFDSIVNEGKIRVKNKNNEFVAKCGLEEYLKKKYVNFNKLIIISCEKDFAENILSAFDDTQNNDILNTFNEIFGNG